MGHPLVTAGPVVIIGLFVDYRHNFITFLINETIFAS